MRYGRLFTAVIVMVFALFAMAIAKADCGCTKSNSNSDTKDRVSMLMHWLDKIGNPKNPMNKQDMEKFYSKNTEQYTNGKLVAKGMDNLYQRFSSIRNQYESAQIELPLQNVVVDGNRAAIRYVVKFTDKDGIHRINDIAIIQFDKQGKVTQFWESFDAGDPVKS